MNLETITDLLLPAKQTNKHMHVKSTCLLQYLQHNLVEIMIKVQPHVSGSEILGGALNNRNSPNVSL